MLHIVQVVMWGVAEKPLLFLDEANARSVYAACAKKYWEQRYSAYCEHHGISDDSFASAQAFMDTIDISEKSRINFWTLNREEAGLGDSKTGQEEFRHIARDIDAVREGLTRLLDDVSNLAERCAGTDVLLIGAQAAGGPEKTALPLSALPQEKPELDPEAYSTAEWKAFAGTIKRLCSGGRNEFYLLPRNDWRQDVYSNRTSLEYWDWCADRIVKYKETAKYAACSIIEAPDSPGCYKFANQEGIASEDSYDSEWEAWCAAGLHREAHCRAAAV